MFIKRLLMMSSQTTFWDCCIHFCAFSDNPSRNSCILPFSKLYKDRQEIEKGHFLFVANYTCSKAEITWL